MNDGLFIVLSGPSGAGKTSFVERALKEYSDFQKPVSYTTRSPRSGEVNGKSYYFVDRDRFHELQGKKAFVEWAEIYGEFYGTSFAEVQGIWTSGKSIIKDLDIQGMRSVKNAFSRVFTVFIAPPSHDVLKQRFLKREKGLSSLSDRLSQAKQEMAWKEHCDYSVVNGDFEIAWTQLRKIIEAAKKL